jgi:hypothetical protein
MKSLCITMGPDWHLAEAEFKRVGLTVERFDAIVQDNRVLAFNKSVYACMKKAHLIENGYPITGSGHKELFDDLLLFEDDVVFDDGFDWLKVGFAQKQLPKDFTTLHLGCNFLGFDNTVWQMPEYFSPHLAKLHNCYMSHATLYSAECVKYIIENFKFVTDEYATAGCEIFDDWLRRHVLPMGRSYLMNPMIAYQRPRKSEIWNVQADYTYCHIYGNKWLKENL